ncbi:hypothetical protein M2349_000014 [Caldanaerobacter subterraneus subsp. tengcongensis MB4]|uniref:Uncharacterized protein n=2 Tax=Caldanaerobacter subterraneus TaxID=911092 RepID=Q8R7M6_CALS4|nr:hypothetical protein [Caldanaerobacter subterraneus]AAM25516.1 hypothetical protein TTE2377 [Caldanaerobacter subterraneus subsp. tengcongensis MB4]KKC28972.1 hypothetical protein CDSM653_02054 [Caldanaerobacter subterraneus subsp. pacificus DSM 12653]MCS3914873.1 hypothetical protein [Caldanaerobacter subterraneus subsp. tengcongensis MB4]
MAFKILGLTLLFIFFSMLEVPRLLREKRLKEVVVFFIFLIAGYVLNLFYVLNIQIIPANRIISFLLKPIEKFWGQ